MYCKNCRTEFFSMDKSCPKCGGKGGDSPDGAKRLKIGTLIKVGIALMIAFFVVGMFMAKKEAEKKKGKNIDVQQIQDDGGPVIIEK